MILDNKKEINANEEKQPLNQADQQSLPGTLQNQQGDAPSSLPNAQKRQRQTALQSSIQSALNWLKLSISFTMFLDVILGELLWQILQIFMDSFEFRINTKSILAEFSQRLLNMHHILLLFLNISGLTQACLFNGIESPQFLSQTVLLFMAISFVFLVITYKFVSVLNKYWIRILKFLLFFWAITLVVFAIVAFAYTSQSDQQASLFNNFSNLSQITQQYYQDLCSGEGLSDCLKTRYKRNGIFIGIFYAVNGLFIFIILLQLMNLEVPEHFRPSSTSIRVGNEKTFIIYDTRYTTIRKKVEKNADGDSQQGSQQDLENPQNNNILNKNLNNLEGDPNKEPFKHLSKPYN